MSIGGLIFERSKVPTGAKGLISPEFTVEVIIIMLFRVEVILFGESTP